MIHDPSHITPPKIAQNIHLEPCEMETLRKLAFEWAEIASLSVHKEKPDFGKN